MEWYRRAGVIAGRRTIKVVTATLFVMASVTAKAAADDENDRGADIPVADAARTYQFLPFGASPRTTAQLATGHFWGGYNGSTHGPVGEALVDGRVTELLALRVGATSS